ncbi:hypothetical protein [Lactobacillus phage Satyr]|uniref:Uncharacterized protein n=1 Tax=Lactobacillus phage Satyr TaxID=2070201 RepID=A0A2K9V535_9CAUD|nr:hypothetical protein HOS71_gp026 [Lactobacillus phage Satyr]AUV57274.1 hypothetical protein [Lactobacillus phage Satyr]
MIKVYRKTATIKAEQFDGTKQNADKLGLFKYRGGWYLETLEGSMLVTNGYWIATGVNGEHWAIADDVFKKTYAELPVIPKNVANYLVDCKHDHTTIGTSLSGNIVLFGHARTPDMIHDILSWLRPYDNQDLFARAWLDGFQTEEEK